MKRLRPMVLGMILATASTLGLAQQPAHQPPTATELFALRLERLSTCAQLAKKILDTRGGHSADWDEPTVDVRYDPATDRCYVKIVMISAGGSFNLWDRQTEDLLARLARTTIYTNLWDGQTQDLLATTMISQNGQRRFGMVFANDPNYKHTLPSADNGYGFDNADDYINRLMYENR
jgi:hypothetical protein